MLRGIARTLGLSGVIGLMLFPSLPCWAADTTPPTTPSVTDDGAYTSSTSRLHATWRSSDPQSGIAEYQCSIRQGFPAGPIVVSWSSRGTSTSVTRTGLTLTQGESYYFGVKAKNRVGLWSPEGYSNGIRVDTTAPSVPGIPTEGAVSDEDYDGDGSYRVYWPAAVDSESGITAYELQQKQGTGSWSRLTASAANPWYSVTGRSDRQRYYYRIRAKNGAGFWSPFSTVSDGILIDKTAPSAVTVTDDGAATGSFTTLHATWTASSDPQSGIAEYQYLIRQDSSVGPLIVDWTSAGTTLEITRTGLALVQEKSYFTGVRAKNGAGLFSAPRYSDGITVRDTTPPATPVVTDDGEWTTSATSLHASWTSSDPETNIAEYQYAIGTSSGGTQVVGWTSAGLLTEVTRASLSLTDGAAYYVSVKARNGVGLWSSVGSSDGIVVDTSPPSIPAVSGSVVFANSATSLNASWTSSDPHTGIAAYRYRITRDSPTGPTLVDWTPTGTSTTVNPTGLTLSASVTYYFDVQAQNAAGSWSLVGTSDGIIMDATSPSTPVVTDDGEWTQVTDRLHASWSSLDSESGVVEYQYAIGTTVGGIDVRGWTSTGTTAEATVTGLTLAPGITCYVSVKARNGAGLWSAVGVSDGIQVVDVAPTLEPIGDKIIRVRPPPAAPPEAPESSLVSSEGFSETVVEGADEPPVLLMKLSPAVAPRMEDAVRAGQRLRARISPARLQRLLRRSHTSEEPLNMAELCCKHEIQNIRPLFAHRSHGLDQILRMELPRGRRGLPGAASEFFRQPQMIYCEPRMKLKLFQTPNDPYLNSSGSWGQSYPDLWGLKRIQAEQAWDVTAGSPDVVVAVIDTGIDPDHSDLFPNLWRNPREIPGNGRDDDGNDYVDDVSGWDFVSWDDGAEDLDPADGHGHGTHVAGTIAAVGDNGQGVIGVAWKCQVMALKGLSDEGSGSSDDLARAIIYAADNGARVINMSWGGEGRSQVLEDVLRYAHGKGVVLVAAAGNSDTDAAGFTPANVPEVITVASTDHTDHRSSFSNWGSKIDVAAPGGDGRDTDGDNRAGANILSCRANGTDMYGDGKNLLGEYARARGTSMAAPHAAGLCALLVSNNPALTNKQVREILRASADDILDPLNNGSNFQGMDIYTGAGRVNAAHALRFSLPLDVQILSPSEGEHVSAGLIEIRGSTVAPFFDHYRLLLGYGANPSEWTELERRSQPVQAGLLGQWTVGPSDFGTYSLKLQVWLRDSAAPIEHQIAVLRTFPYAQGWPLDFSATGQEGQVLVYGDLNGNGETTFVTSVRSTSGDLLGLVDSRGRAKSGWPRRIKQTGSYKVGRVVLADVDGDGSLEIVGLAGAGTDPSPLWNSRVILLFAIRSDGTDLPGWPVELKGEPGSYVAVVHPPLAPLVADLDADGLAEVAVFWSEKPPGYLQGKIQGYLELFSSQGTRLPGWPKLTTLGNFYETLVPLCAADLEGDGRPELVCMMHLSSGQETLHPFRKDGSVPSGWPVPNPAEFSDTVWTADVNSDGQDELVASYDRFGSHRFRIVWGNGVVSSEIGTLWGFNNAGGLGTLYDLDGDGELEFLRDYGLAVEAVSLSGEVRWSAQSPLFSGWQFYNPGDIFVADLDRDGQAEIFVVSNDALDEVTLGFEGTGTPLRDWPVRGQGRAQMATAFGDVDGDGDIELIGATRGEMAAYDLQGRLANGWPLPLAPSSGSWSGNLQIDCFDANEDGRIEPYASGNHRAWMWNVPIAGLALPTGERSLPVTHSVQVSSWDPPRSMLIYPPRYINGEYGTLIIKLKGTDPDGGRLPYSANGLPAGASFNAAKGFFRWRPTLEQGGTYNVTFTVSDGKATANETITITVRAGNSPPELTLPITSYQVDEGQPLEFTLAAADPDGDRIQFLGENLPKGASVDRKTGRFTWRPDFAQAGEYLISLSAGDGSLKDSVVVRVTVRNVNRAPTLVNPGDRVLQEGEILEFLLNAVDPDGDPLTFTAVSLPPGVVFVPETGLFSWQPTFEQAGNYGPITVTASDGTLTAVESFRITVQGRSPWTTPPSAGSFTFDWVPTPTNVVTQTIGGTKPAYTAVLVNGVEQVARDRFTTWSAQVALSEGSNSLAVQVKDLAGLVSAPIQRTVLLDTTPPSLTVTSPSPGQVIPLTGAGSS